ncbi:MAG: NUDIX hydrolase, partial [Gammaproteobacteria bacterium]
MKYCSNCGETVEKRIPEDDNRLRHYCTSCESIHYLNPKIIVGTVPIKNGKVLLCKRAIPPRYGLWTIPAGFLENGETIEQGAFRET